MKVSVGRGGTDVLGRGEQILTNVFYKNNNKNKLALKTTKGAINY